MPYFYDLEVAEDDHFFRTSQQEKYHERSIYTDNQKLLSTRRMRWKYRLPPLFLLKKWQKKNVTKCYGVSQIDFRHLAENRRVFFEDFGCFETNFNRKLPTVAAQIRCGFLRSTASNFWPGLNIFSDGVRGSGTNIDAVASGALFNVFCKNCGQHEAFERNPESV